MCIIILVCISILIIIRTCSLIVGILRCIGIVSVLGSIPFIFICVKSTFASGAYILINIYFILISVCDMIWIVHTTIININPAVIHILLRYITPRYGWYSSCFQIIQIKWVHWIYITWIKCGFPLTISIIAIVDKHVTVWIMINIFVNRIWI